MKDISEDKVKQTSYRHNPKTKESCLVIPVSITTDREHFSESNGKTVEIQRP